MQELPAELHRMTALDPGGLFVELIGLGECVRVGRNRPGQREAAAYADVASVAVYPGIYFVTKAAN